MFIWMNYAVADSHRLLCDVVWQLLQWC